MSEESASARRHVDRGGTALPIALLGASTAVLQVVAVREGMAATSGNEAVVALLFGIWLLATAAGAALGRGRLPGGRANVAAALLGHALLSPLTLVAARATSLLHHPGFVPSLGWSAVAAAAILGPSCVSSGWIYARLADAEAGDGDAGEGSTVAVREAVAGDGASAEGSRGGAGRGQGAARAYLLDTLGAGVAGAALALVALDRLLPLHVAALASASSGAAAAALLRGTPRVLASLATLAMVCAPWLADLETRTSLWQLPAQQIVQVRSSSRGSIVVTRAREQVEVLVQREPVLSTGDANAAELAAHLPLALHPRPLAVLHVGVAPASAFVAMAAHGVQRIDEVVGEERLAQVVHRWDPGARAPGVRVLGEDERAFVRAARSDYDVAIVGAGQPTSVSGARLFSAELYADLKRALRPGGVAVVRMPGHASYANLEQRRMHSSVATTLRSAFAHVAALPGPSTLYVASDAPLPDLAKLVDTLDSRLGERGVARGLVTRAWLDDTLSPQRLADAARWSSMAVERSTDAHPVVYRLALDASLSRLGEGGPGVLAVLALVLVLSGLLWLNPLTRPLPFSVATTGAAGLGLQLALMLVVQTAVAALYRDVALVTSAFMAASCAGTLWGSRRRFGVGLLVAGDLAQALLAVGLAVLGGALFTLPGAAARVAIVACAGAVGAVTGAQIALASIAPGAWATGRGGLVFAADLGGAALAALLTYTVAVPALGIAGTALALASLKVVSAAALVARREHVRAVAAPMRVPGPAIALLTAVVLAIIDDTERVLYALTVTRSFALLVLVQLLVMLALAFEPPRLREQLVQLERRLRAWRRAVALSPVRVFDLLVLLPVGALPLARCYFKVPYLFCHTCPRPCVFGMMRPYLVPAACIANLGDRRFCERACPLGMAQRACESSSAGRARPLGRAAWALRLVVLALVAVLYPMVLSDRRSGVEGVGTFSFFFANSYAVSAWVLGVAGVLLAASFLVRRPFCEALCPIGAVADLAYRLEKRWTAGRQERGAAGSGETS